MLMIVPVLSDPFRIESIIGALREHDVVVLDALRTQAKKLFAEVQMRINAEMGSNAETSLLHLAAWVSVDEGWVEYFCHSDRFEPAESDRYVSDAIVAWVAAGRPPEYRAIVTRHPEPTA